MRARIPPAPVKTTSLSAIRGTWRKLALLAARPPKGGVGNAFYSGGGRTGFLRRVNWEAPSPTLVTDPTMPATLLAHPEELRPLSVQEYQRLQTFPDDWKICGSTAQKYRQLGNAVPVFFLERSYRPPPPSLCRRDHQTSAAPPAAITIRMSWLGRNQLVFRFLR
ncbi:MAG: DNA cytosine methyltransferase [Fimbriimonadaceae bacterium]